VFITKAKPGAMTIIVSGTTLMVAREAIALIKPTT